MLQPEVDRERIGILGICGFGGISINAAVQDTRIKATVSSTMGAFDPYDKCLLIFLFSSCCIIYTSLPIHRLSPNSPARKGRFLAVRDIRNGLPTHQHDTETFLTKSLSHVVAQTLSGSYHYDCLFIHCHLYLISGAKVERMPFQEVALRLKVLLLYGSIKNI